MGSNSSIIVTGICAGGLLYTGFSAVTVAGWIAAALTLLYIEAAFFTEDQPPKLYYVDTPKNRHLIQQCRRLREPFRPPYWARNQHMQTVLPVILPKVDFKFKREVLELRDGGVLTLDYGISGVDSLKPNSPLLVALPGLNGDSGYVIYLCKEAARRGYRPIVFNKRGLAGSEITTPKLQSFGDPYDFREVMEFLRKSYPESEIAAAGVSAGSGLLASYLGEYGASCDIVAAFCNCPGYFLKELFHSLTQPYDFVILQGLKQMLRRHRTMLSKILDVDAALKAKRCMEIEALVYRKIYGYKTMEEYFEHNEPMRGLEMSVPPVLCVNSADDPVCIERLFPYNSFKTLTNGILAVTSEGGHCGFLERGTWNRWADDLAMDFIDAVIDYNKNNGKN